MDACNERVKKKWNNIILYVNRFSFWIFHFYYTFYFFVSSVLRNDIEFKHVFGASSECNDKKDNGRMRPISPKYNPYILDIIYIKNLKKAMAIFFKSNILFSHTKNNYF